MQHDLTIGQQWKLTGESLKNGGNFWKSTDKWTFVEITDSSLDELGSKGTFSIKMDLCIKKLYVFQKLKLVQSSLLIHLFTLYVAKC